MNKFKNFCYLLTYSGQKYKKLLFSKSVRYFFNAILPLINIAGLGIIINTLTNEPSKNNIVNLICFYVIINLGISILSSILTLIDDIAMRHYSDITQLNYMYDCIYINYHYVQDGSILDLKKKSMGANPVWFLDTIGKILQCIIQFIGIFYIFSLLSPHFIIILFAVSTISIILSFKQQKIDFDFKNSQIQDKRKLEYLYKTMSHYKFAKEIRINNANEYISNKYSKILSKYLEKFQTFTEKNFKINTSITFINILQLALMYFYFSYQVFNRKIDIGEYSVLLSTTTLFTSIFLDFFEKIAILNKTLNYTELFKSYNLLIEENSNISSSRFLPSILLDTNNIEISFENVSFTYPNTSKLILHNINFTIKQGEKIAIVGLNASGKSTIIKLICRLYEPTEGKITINGIDIQTIPLNTYAKLLGIVLQDYHLFSYSIKENIVFDNEFNEKKLWDIIHKINLEQKISSLENNINSFIYKNLNSNGIEFSGGETQKLALARALYKNASILILDEPTSALDPIAEYELFSKLSEISEGKTSIFISHRLSSTKFCDRILVLYQGTIFESGSHNELMKKNGFYAELFNSQLKYYIAKK